MKRHLFVLLFVGSVAMGAVLGDSDFDGVADARDACPGTPFEALVGTDGCPIEASKTPVVVVAGIGATYASGTYAGNFSFSAFGAYYYRGAYDPAVSTYDGGGLSDTLLSAAYTLRPSARLSLTPGVHIKLATGDSGIGTGENDYGPSLLANLHLASLELFALGGYTFTGDSADVEYRDIFFASAGVM